MQTFQTLEKVFVINTKVLGKYWSKAVSICKLGQLVSQSTGYLTPKGTDGLPNSLHFENIFGKSVS